MADIQHSSFMTVVKTVSFVILIAISMSVTVYLFLNFSEKPFERIIWGSFAFAIEGSKVWALVNVFRNLRSRKWSAVVGRFAFYAVLAAVSIFASYSYSLSSIQGAVDVTAVADYQDAASKAQIDTIDKQIAILLKRQADMPPDFVTASNKITQQVNELEARKSELILQVTKAPVRKSTAKSVFQLTGEAIGWSAKRVMFTILILLSFIIEGCIVSTAPSGYHGPATKPNGKRVYTRRKTILDLKASVASGFEPHTLDFLAPLPYSQPRQLAIGLLEQEPLPPRDQPAQAEERPETLLSPEPLPLGPDLSNGNGGGNGKAASKKKASPKPRRAARSRATAEPSPTAAPAHEAAEGPRAEAPEAAEAQPSDPEKVVLEKLTGARVEIEVSESARPRPMKFGGSTPQEKAQFVAFLDALFSSDGNGLSDMKNAMKSAGISATLAVDWFKKLMETRGEKGKPLVEIRNKHYFPHFDKAYILNMMTVETDWTR